MFKGSFIAWFWLHFHLWRLCSWTWCRLAEACAEKEDLIEEFSHYHWNTACPLPPGEPGRTRRLYPRSYHEEPTY
jgi:hypothetical protein